jgi:tetratricopeptide (TPR) repeat protein
MNSLRFVTVVVLTSISLLLSGQSTETRVADKMYAIYDFDQALEIYLKLAEEQPLSTHIQSRIGRSYFYTNQPLKAVSWLSLSANAELPEPSDLFFLGSSLQMIGNYKEAIEVWEKYKEVDPSVASQRIKASTLAIDHLNSAPSFSVQKAAFNSANSDFGISRYNNQIYFSSYRKPIGKNSDKLAYGDVNHYLYQTDHVDRVPSNKVKMYKNSLTFNAGEGGITFSPDGKEVIFMKAPFKEKNRLVGEAGFKSSLYIANVNGNGQWENIRSFPFNGAEFSSAWPYITEDGLTLYFSSDRPGGYGGFDLYRCRRQGNEWGVPENLGGVINTSGNEITPFQLGGQFYFASDWHLGYGGYDLFKAISDRDITSHILNLGKDINSPSDDIGMFWQDKKSGYFVSNREGNGFLDIYHFNQDVFQRFIEVRDEVKNMPVKDAKVSIEGCLNTNLMTDMQGIAALVFSNELPCSISISHPDYLPVTFSDPFALQDFLPVYLKTKKSELTLKLFNIDSGEPLSNVKLRLTNQKTGEFNDFLSDGKGNMVLNDVAGGIFYANFFKIGFESYALTLTREILDSGTFNKEISLKPLQGFSPDENIAKQSSGSTDNQSIQSKEGLNKPVYAVQVAAIKASSQADLKSYTNLSRFGTVYQKEDGALIRIRLGLFDSKEKATTIAREMDLLGYKGAYVVVEQSESLMDQIMLSMAKHKPAMAKSEGDYRVRLAAYRDPQWFAPQGLEKYGNIEEEINGEWTVKYIAGIKSMVVAREALLDAKSKGFEQAYLLQKIGDIESKIE